MKKIALMLFAAASMSLMGCTGNADNNATEGDSTAQTEAGAEDDAWNPFPWDFPQDFTLNAEMGQTVLAPYTFYKGAQEEKKDLTKETLIFYNNTLGQVGDKISEVGGSQVPNPLIIPIAKGQEAKAGDIVLTWWQGGSGLQRAIIVDASNPKQPKANFLDLSWDRGNSPDKESMGESNANRELKENSFQVIKDGEWVPGAQIAAMKDGKWEAKKLINEKDGKLIVLAFASKVEVVDKSNCKLIPFNEDIKVGDSVYALFVSSYDDGYKVVAVDKAKGLITCEKDGKQKVYPVTEVTKVL